MKRCKLFATIILLLMAAGISGQNLAVYVSDAGSFSTGPWQIAKFDENGTYEGALMNDADGIVWPQDIIFLDNEQAVLISNLSTAGIISKHEWDTGNLIENFAEGIAGPTRMKIGPDGLLYVLQWSNTDNKVLRYQLDGTFVDEFSEVGVVQSIGIDWDSNGDFYVSSYGQSTIRKFDGTNGDDLGLFIDTGLQGPTNIFFEPGGDLIVFNYNSGIIKRFDSNGNFVEDLITGVNGCEGFAFFPNGDLLIGVGSDGSVRRYDSSYNFIENFVDIGVLNTPNAIVIRDDIPLAVRENALKLIMVTPTIGTAFTITDQAMNNYNTFYLHNTQGMLIDSIDPSINRTYNASHLAEGIYFLSATNGENRITQKIVVMFK
ncbi:T9SS type A sorting domain-containing protein [Aureitalea sp. L0-47]|uniref:T9SS type A sorting domain-containing protein n=1 Tax=Aureitalea sp. L0-47 TaxID=2816962 RepID=UPI0022384A2D|nr:T9SS type A sorting domain-containing protein [Aureitalea sp. L0-47]MCW5520101.1 T9SS type A sorting domain-containing protein [Aureitalea sp. L0-47]